MTISVILLNHYIFYICLCFLKYTSYEETITYIQLKTIYNILIRGLIVNGINYGNFCIVK